MIPFLAVPHPNPSINEIYRNKRSLLIYVFHIGVCQGIEQWLQLSSAIRIRYLRLPRRAANSQPTALLWFQEDSYSEEDSGTEEVSEAED